MSLLLFAGPIFPDDQGMVKSWEGDLQLFGSEPFTHLALVTDNRERWYLEMEEQELRRLWRENRGRIRITGTPVTKEIQGHEENVIIVKKYEWLE